MNVSLNWLKSLIDLPESPEALADLLTFAGIEVENISTRGVAFDHVVVGEVLSFVPHPNADRLRLCQVADGSDIPRQIVCGAKNFSVGDKVALALPGAVLPGDFKIKSGKLRGEKSEGMMCSAKELELADDAEGLIILPSNAKTGAPISEVFESDTLFELEITPNRPDLLSHYGIARELAVLTGRALQLPPSPPIPATETAHPVQIQSQDRCSQYWATRIAGVTVQPSPDWLRQRLESIGLRPINNIVDITNFIMMQWGQPLHAFDLDKLTGNIQIRQAVAGETLLALDKETYTLREHDLVIADSERPVALAGVIGGEASGVTDPTTSILLESAAFLPASVRKSSRELNASTDSSYRFERGIDPELPQIATQHAIQLILELAGGTVEAGPTLTGTIPPAPAPVTLRPAKVCSLLGATISNEKITSILTNLGLTLLDSDETTQSWKIPTFRGDLTREVDLIEEISRIYGLDNLDTTLSSLLLPESPADRVYDFQRSLARKLASIGFYESRTLSLLHNDSLEDDVRAARSILKIKNPLGEDTAILRPSLLPALIQAVGANFRKSAATVRLFEIGRVFSADAPEEAPVLGLVASGNARPHHWQTGLATKITIFDVKAAIESLSLPGLRMEATGGTNLLPLRINLLLGNKPIGVIGQLAPARARALDCKSPVFVAEIELTPFLRSLKAERPMKFKPLQRFPATSRDIALLVPTSVQHEEILQILQKAKQPLLTDIQLFDYFTDPTGKKIPSDKKSLAYSLTYQSNERTLSSEEVQAVHDQLKALLAEIPGATLRE